MTCAHCHPPWRGVAPILGLLAIIACCGIIAYECGRYHRNPAAMAEAARDRVRYIVVPEPVYRPAEPDHAGKR